MKNKYNIHQSVLVYEKGKLVNKVINKIKIEVTHKGFKVGYAFEGERGSIFNDYTNEDEVFKSVDEFVEKIQSINSLPSP